MIQQNKHSKYRICSRTLLSTVYYLPSFLFILSHAMLSPSVYENFSVLMWNVRLNHKILFIYLSQLAVMQ